LISALSRPAGEAGGIFLMSDWSIDLIRLSVLLLSLAASASASAAAPKPTVYVDCAAGADARPGTVTSLDALNALSFAPGTRILFRRGVTCHGSFAPRPGNSGKPGAPIVVAAYGDRAAGRPVIAAGCRDAQLDADRTLTAGARTAQGISPYRSLCRADDGAVRRAAIHLVNVEHWEIDGLELTNDGLRDGPRVGLLVQLEDFGTGSHYRVRDVYVHHVRGYLKDAPDSPHVYKETGGILFNVTRHGEQPGTPQRRTRFDDVVVENSEIYHVDAIGLSNRSAWMCRAGGAPCGDYPPYKGNKTLLTADAADEFTPSTGIVFRNNRIHDIGGDGIVVRTATQPRIEANLLYDIWMRTPGNSAGAWAINTDGALFQYNEVHHVRWQGIDPGDGMAFDADLGTRDTRIVANYSHDNAGGFVLFCGCGNDGIGHPAQASGTLVEDNLSVDDGRRIVMFAGSASALVRRNLVIATRPEVVAPAAENSGLGSRNAAEIRDNVFVHAAGKGALFRAVKPDVRHEDIRWSGNRFYGYDATGDFDGAQFFAGDAPNRRLPASRADPQALVRAWFKSTDFRAHAYAAGIDGVQQPASRASASK
jgi:hypothetical protein